MDKIKLIDDQGEELAFFVEEQVRIGGVTYLLVSESKDGDSDAYILKDTSEDTSPEACYEFVEDELEMDVVSGVFQQMLEDVEIQK